MCDFSQYGGPSEEWLAVEKTLPALTFDISLDPVVLKKTVNEQREEAAAKDMVALAPKLHLTTHTIPTRDGSSVKARSYRLKSKSEDEKLPVFLYFHGGGFLFGSLGTDDAACARVAINLGIVVLSVNYRHTPEHIFPTAWHDTQDSFAWLHSNASLLSIDPTKVLVGGVSAGGQLTASLVLEKHLGKSDVLNGLPEIAGQILIIPALAHLSNYADGPLRKMASPAISSYVENEHAPILPKSTIEFFMSLLKTGTPSLTDTKLNVVNALAEDLKELPPTVSGIAGLDPLRDEGLLYAKVLAEAGVPTETRLFKGVPHGFRRFGDRLKSCREWDRCVEEGIVWCLEKPKAGGFEVKVV